MKKTVLLLAIAAAFLPLHSGAQVTNGFSTIVSSAAGGTKSAFTFVPSGNTSFTFAGGSDALGAVVWPTAFTGALGSPAGAWSLPGTNFYSFPAIGYVTNFQAFTSRLITGLRLTPTMMALAFDGELLMLPGESWDLVLDSNPAQFEIDLAFSNFTPGTYNTTANLLESGDKFYNLEIVPEPSTFALLALAAAGLGGYVLRRRRK